MNDKKLARILSLWLPVFVWAGVIFAFSGLPTNPVSEIHWKDFIFKKTLHLIEYAVLTVFAYRALKNYFDSKKKALIVSFMVSAFYGATDEFHQSFTPGRSPSARDVIIDACGSLLSILFVYKILPTSSGLVKSVAAKFDLI